MEMNEFLDELASSSPAPGGGSVSALCGSLGAALNSMVCNLTIDKKGYEEVNEEMKGVLEQSEVLRNRLHQLIDEDAEAFNKVMDAFKLPKESEEETKIRRETIQEAFKGAANVPLTVASLCLKVLETSRMVAEKGNKRSVTDAAVSALIARAGLHGAALNVRINLGSIKDAEFNQKALQELEVLNEKSLTLTEETLGIVEKQLGA